MLTLVVFLVGVVASYYFIRFEVDEKIDFRLRDEKKFLQDLTDLENVRRYRAPLGDHLEIIPVESIVDFVEERKDTIIVEPQRRREVVFRQLRFAHTVNGQSYIIVLRKALVESRDLTEALFRAVMVVAAALLLMLLIIQYFLSKRIWKPFYATIKRINHLDLTKTGGIELPGSLVNEFNTLNKALSNMSQKIHADYARLKEFSENASHEMQTPLSVIKLKTETLLQSENLADEDIRQIEAIERAASKLSRLNASLLLLTKIENRQFADDVEVDLQERLKEQLQEIEELARLKNLKIEKQSEQLVLRMNPMLADILLKNLLINAMNYCRQNGRINITLTGSGLTVANQGEPLKIKPEQLFERFTKNDPSSPSLGLGLSIVKTICDIYNLQIRYDYRDGYHTFDILP